MNAPHLRTPSSPPPPSPEPDFLGMAISLAVQNVHENGGPFGTIVVLEDGLLVPGSNRVTTSNDPTAHAEITAIRAAGARSNSFDLTGGVLYTSCAPCPMCLTAAMWARLDAVVYAARPEDAAAAGFDDAEFYRQVATVTGSPLYPQPLTFNHVAPMRVTHSLHIDRLAPFEAWNSLSSLERVRY